ncbi:MAG: hypothetical protein QOJ65_2402 [Fimbriimonadaceae bacterium]|jgi:hypothetical protein|nr:hypothetical protein [Fimbriimonadaceae bacterium]
MSNRSIYVTNGGEKDLSRWISIYPVSGSDCLVKLQDLAHPGLPSALKEFRCPVSVLKDLEQEGFVQITLPDGYCQLRNVGESVEVAFKGHSDEHTVHCELHRDDFAMLLSQIAGSPRAVAL